MSTKEKKLPLGRMVTDCVAMQKSLVAEFERTVPRKLRAFMNEMNADRATNQRVSFARELVTTEQADGSYDATDGGIGRTLAEFKASMNMLASAWGVAVEIKDDGNDLFLLTVRCRGKPKPKQKKRRTVTPRQVADIGRESVLKQNAITTSLPRY